MQTIINRSSHLNNDAGAVLMGKDYEMQETLISLGAEILRVTPEIDIGKIILVACLLMLLIYIGYIIYRSFPKARLALKCIYILLIIGAIVLRIMVLPYAERNNRYEIRVNDQTDLAEIFQQFEVTDTSNYPILMVRSK